MAKKKQPSKETVINTDLSKDELVKAIVEAYEQIENNKELRRQKEKTEWLEKLGLGRKSSSQNKIVKALQNIFYDITDISKLLFIKKENILEGAVTTNLMRMVLSLLFGTLTLFLYFCTLVWAAQGASMILSDTDTATAIGHIAFAVAAFLFARIFRIAALEAEYMKDREFLVATFAGVTSFAAVIVSVVALVKG